MRYSDLDIVSTLDVRAGKQSVKLSAMDDTVSKHSKDLNCNETSLNEILDNCSISDEDCSTERTDNSNDNNGTELEQSIIPLRNTIVASVPIVIHGTLNQIIQYTKYRINCGNRLHHYMKGFGCTYTLL